MRFDVLHQLPALVRCQAALQAQALAQTCLAEHGVVDNFVGQATGQETLAGFVPVQGHQLAEASGLLRIIEEGRLLQLHFPRFAVEQVQATQGELGLADVEVGQADVPIDHPVGLVTCGHDAQFVRRAFVGRALTSEGAGAVGDVARQGMVARCLVVAGIVAIAPHCCSQAVAQVRAQLQAGIGEACMALKTCNWVSGVIGDSSCCHPTAWRSG